MYCKSFLHLNTRKLVSDLPSFLLTSVFLPTYSSHILPSSDVHVLRHQLEKQQYFPVQTLVVKRRGMYGYWQVRCANAENILITYIVLPLFFFFFTRPKCTVPTSSFIDLSVNDVLKEEKWTNWGKRARENDNKERSLAQNKILKPCNYGRGHSRK